MEPDLLRASIHREIAKLRAASPRITACHATIEEWHEAGVPRHALQLDIRSPEHQSLISGPARDNVDEALRAAFDAAAEQMVSIASRDRRLYRLAA
jgi:hypothetical protein